AVEPGTFVLAVRFHLFLAAILAIHIALLALLVWRHLGGIQPLRGLASLLVLLLAAQLALGGATWIVKFAAPAWAPSWLSPGPALAAAGSRALPIMSSSPSRESWSWSW